MRGFLQVVSLFGVPLAIVIWYDLLTNTDGYLHSFDFKASRPVAIGIHIVTALLCFHLPFWIWRRFDPMVLRRFCLTAALAMFWVAARLVSSGGAESIPILDSVAVFLVPVVVYFALCHFLFRWSRSEFETEEQMAADAVGDETPNSKSDSKSDSEDGYA